MLDPLSLDEFAMALPVSLPDPSPAPRDPVDDAAEIFLEVRRRLSLGQALAFAGGYLLAAHGRQVFEDRARDLRVRCMEGEA